MLSHFQFLPAPSDPILVQLPITGSATFNEFYSSSRRVHHLYGRISSLAKENEMKCSFLLSLFLSFPLHVFLFGLTLSGPDIKMCPPLLMQNPGPFPGPQGASVISIIIKRPFVPYFYELVFMMNILRTTRTQSIINKLKTAFFLFLIF